METDCWCFWMSSFTWGNAGSSEWRFRTLTRSDERASLEVSSSERKADKLLVRSSPRINGNLTNSAMSVRTRVHSNSLMPPISCMVWRWMAWMCSRILRVVSKALSPWCVVSVGNAALLPPATTWGAFPGAGASFGDTSAPSDSPSRSCSAHLASCHRLIISTVKGNMRSEVMFQWSPEGGLRFIAILDPCIGPWGNFSGLYSSMDVVASPRKWGKVTWRNNSPPDCWVHMVWSLKPLKERGAMGSPVLVMVSLVATSNKMGCCATTGITSLILETLTNIRCDKLSLSADSTLEPADACRWCRRAPWKCS